MVHVLCVNGDCRWMLHLDNFAHWNYEGQITCPKCESVLMLVVKDGQVLSASPMERLKPVDQLPNLERT